MVNFGIAIHGGAGTILKSEMTKEKEQSYRDGLQRSIDTGYSLLEKGASSLEAVEAAIVSMEDNPLFNAGKGAVFNARGQHEMDASIMDGKTLNAGAIAAVRNLKNPIILAHKVLNYSDHVLLIGEGACDFAERHNIEFEKDEYFYDVQRYQQWQSIKDTSSFQLDHSKEKKSLGTVGAVALDKHGNLAAGTSTGGMTNKKFGRVGDSPIIGAGNYANNLTCAVSCTGSGEYIMRGMIAYDISCLMRYKNLALDEACRQAIEHLTVLDGDGGVVAIDANGNMAMPFNCEGMYRAYKNMSGTAVSIYR